MINEEDMSNENLLDALEYDPLSQAESLTGKRDKNDHDTMMVGMALVQINAKRKENILKERDDTTFSCSFADYFRIVKDIGFEVVFEQEIENTDSNDNDKKDLHYIMWHKEHGILLVFDTYWGAKRINSARFYYNWRDGLPEGRGNYELLSSGSWNKVDGEYVWSGNHDGREAIRFRIDNLLKYGEFLPQWVDTPSLWLLNYSDTKDVSRDVTGFDTFDEMNRNYINKLPKHVKDAIGANKEK